MKLRDYIQTRRFETMQSRIKKQQHPALELQAQATKAYTDGLEVMKSHQDRLQQQAFLQTLSLERIADALEEAGK